mmetsp:Transcript_2398/g.7656  ORF Transcript_2398/g.7656 Transcript_2398/m.7656 type:complete len:244 (+) Transcript_2398:1025-1756(+)
MPPRRPAPSPGPASLSSPALREHPPPSQASVGKPTHRPTPGEPVWIRRRAAPVSLARSAPSPGCCGRLPRRPLRVERWSCRRNAPLGASPRQAPPPPQRPVLRCRPNPDDRRPAWTSEAPVGSAARPPQRRLQQPLLAPLATPLALPQPPVPASAGPPLPLPPSERHAAPRDRAVRQPWAEGWHQRWAEGWQGPLRRPAPATHPRTLGTPACSRAPSSRACRLPCRLRRHGQRHARPSSCAAK